MLRETLERMLSYDMQYAGKQLYIWGTGNTASLYQEGLSRLEDEGIVISGYADNNRDKWGTVFGRNKPVISPDELKRKQNILVLIASPQPAVIGAVGDQLQALGLKHLHIDAFILGLHKRDVLACFDLLEDEKSRALYVELVDCKLHGRYPREEYVESGEQYFSFADFGDRANEVFVDAGAYVGDTAERYIWRTSGAFRKIIAFEPDRESLWAMDHRLDRLKKEWNLKDSQFAVYPYGVSDVSSTAYVSRYETNNGYGTKLTATESSNSEIVQSVSIDDCVKEPYQFLKADIESYEYRMLLGAQSSIRMYRPRLAICIYHNAVDFYSVPLLIREINPDYKFSVRHYTHQLSDTVLYAYF